MREREADAEPFFLPLGSLDPNPVEQAFAKLKHEFRQAQVRSIEEV